MPDSNFQQLLQQLEGQAEQSQKYNNLLTALRAYDTQTANFRQTRRRRKLPLVTAKDKTRLMTLHLAIGKAADELLQDQTASKELRDVVRKITFLSAGHYNALQQYDPSKEAKTLSSLEEDVRTLTLHQGSVELAEALSGAQSERTPLSFLDNKGKEIIGVFSKKKVVEPGVQLRQAFDQMTSMPLFSVRQDAEAVTWLRDHIFEVMKNVQYMQDMAKDKNEDLDYLNALVDICQKEYEDGKEYLDPGTLKEYLGRGMREFGYNADSLTDDSWRQLAQNMEPLISTMLYAHNTGNISYGSRVDNRNAAMSAVADLLGMPNVIARSKPMRVIDKDGNVIEGTFMEAAKGYDVENLPEEAARITPDALKNTDGKAFKDLANLQVLDYICGNYDRHYANMFYRFDANGKLCGIQGIDNDGSFGVIGAAELKDTHKNYFHLVNLSNIKAIPKETAKRIKALDESALKYMLRGYGLSEEELKAAGLRLSYMKQAITRVEQTIREKKKPTIRLMSDSDFKKATIETLRKNDPENDMEETTNLFNITENVVNSLPKLVQKQEREYQALQTTAALGMGNRAERVVAGQERVKAAALDAMLSKRTWWGFSSGNYEALRRAAASYMNVHKALENRLNEANKEENKRMASYRHELDAVVKETDLERMRHASEQLREAALTYLQGKMPLFNENLLDEPVQYPQGASDYTKRRIDVAIDALKLGQQGCEIKEVERQTAQDNQRQAEADQRSHRAERNPLLAIQEAPAQAEVRIRTN